MYLLTLLYGFIAGLYFEHNKNMGHWLPGCFASILWPLTGFLWMLGAVLVFVEDRELKKIIKNG